MRKVFKFVAITAFILEYVLLVGLFSLDGIANYRNRSKYATDSLYVSIKADYKEKFQHKPVYLISENINRLLIHRISDFFFQFSCIFFIVL